MSAKRSKPFRLPRKRGQAAARPVAARWRLSDHGRSRARAARLHAHAGALRAHRQVRALVPHRRQAPVIRSRRAQLLPAPQFPFTPAKETRP